MPRFFFHVSDSKIFFDPCGTELPSWQDARIFAVRYMGEILQSDANLAVENEDWHMDVTDENGLIMLRLDLSILLSPIISRANIFNDDHAIHLENSLNGRPAPLNDR